VYSDGLARHVPGKAPQDTRCLVRTLRHNADANLFAEFDLQRKIVPFTTI
jgi:hypothetical protein